MKKILWSKRKKEGKNLFIWDFAVDTIFEEIMKWFYGQMVGFLSVFFSLMGNMGSELFTLSWVQAVVQFFSYLAWALYVTGLVVACFECAIEYQNGRGNVRDTALNAVKGFMAVSLFTVVPVELFRLSVTMQTSLTVGIAGMSGGLQEVASSIMDKLKEADSLEMAASSGVFGGLDGNGNLIVVLFFLIMMGYSVIKVFFSSLKRGGILLIQIAVGSLYMFSIPRGYIDGFTSWSKQVIGLCLTTFLQVVILTAGLLAMGDQALLGLGLMLASNEIPRIAGQFGLDTSTRANIMGSVNAAQGALNLSKSVTAVIAK